MNYFSDSVMSDNNELLLKNNFPNCYYIIIVRYAPFTAFLLCYTGKL